MSETSAVHRNITIESLSDSEIHILYRFKTKSDLYRIKTCFRIPNIVKFGSNQVVHGDTFLLVGLRRLSSNATLYDLQIYFGINYTSLSKMFKAFILYFSSNWGYLVTNNLQYWSPFIRKCSKVIDLNYFEKSNGNVLDLDSKIFGLIDNTLNPTCRPAGGPMIDGENAPRHDPLIQQAFYTGWKKIHGLKWQTVELPNGMTMHAYGPFSIRRSDAFTCQESQINQLIANLQLNQPVQYKLFGDSAYAPLHYSHILSWRDEISSVREAIEWSYRDLFIMWKMLDHKQLLKIRQMNVGNIFLTGLILKNCYSSIYGSETSNYFNLAPPSIEDWTIRLD